VTALVRRPKGERTETDQPTINPPLVTRQLTFNGTTNTGAQPLTIKHSIQS